MSYHNVFILSRCILDVKPATRLRLWTVGARGSAAAGDSAESQAKRHLKPPQVGRSPRAAAMRLLCEIPRAVDAAPAEGHTLRASPVAASSCCTGLRAISGQRAVFTTSSISAVTFAGATMAWGAIVLSVKRHRKPPLEGRSPRAASKTPDRWIPSPLAAAQADGH